MKAAGDPEVLHNFWTITRDKAKLETFMTTPSPWDIVQLFLGKIGYSSAAVADDTSPCLGALPLGAAVAFVQTRPADDRWRYRASANGRIMEQDELAAISSTTEFADWLSSSAGL